MLALLLLELSWAGLTQDASICTLGYGNAFQSEIAVRGK